MQSWNRTGYNYKTKQDISNSTETLLNLSLFLPPHFHVILCCQIIRLSNHRSVFPLNPFSSFNLILPFKPTFQSLYPTTFLLATFAPPLLPCSAIQKSHAPSNCCPLCPELSPPPATEYFAMPPSCNSLFLT